MAKISLVTGSMGAAFLAVLIGCKSVGTGYMANENIIQVVLDLPELQQYFHIDVLPDRSPLHLVCVESICQDVQFEKFGVPVVKIPSDPDSSQPYLKITHIQQDESSARVLFTYPPEGIAGEVALERDGDNWNVIEAELIES